MPDLATACMNVVLIDIIMPACLCLLSVWKEVAFLLGDVKGILWFILIYLEIYVLSGDVV